MGQAVDMAQAIDMAQPRDAFVEVDAMQPPPPPQFLIDALGEETARLAAATCIRWEDDGSPNGYHPRPERAFADGRMECDPSFEDVPEADRDSSLERRQCAGWPYRPPTPSAGYSPGTPAPRVACSPDRSLCCVGQVLDDLACEDSWTVCDADQPVLGEFNGHFIDILVPSADCPQDIIDAFPSALNGCHFLCQPVCPAPE